MNANEAIIGSKYLAAGDIPVEVIQKEGNVVTLRSGKTGNIINVPLEYQLKESEGEIVMSTENTTDTSAQATPVKRGAKSALIDGGLKGNLPTEEIVKLVLEAFPDLSEKNVRNLVSVRRSKQKKSSTTATA